MNEEKEHKIIKLSNGKYEYRYFIFVKVNKRYAGGVDFQQPYHWRIETESAPESTEATFTDYLQTLAATRVEAMEKVDRAYKRHVTAVKQADEKKRLEPIHQFIYEVERDTMKEYEKYVSSDVYKHVLRSFVCQRILQLPLWTRLAEVLAVVETWGGPGTYYYES